MFSLNRRQKFTVTGLTELMSDLFIHMCKFGKDWPGVFAYRRKTHKFHFYIAMREAQPVINVTIPVNDIDRDTLFMTAHRT